MQHAPITTPITDKLASMTWIRWFRQLVDRVDEIKGTADAPGWETITGKPTEFPPSEHRHEWADLDDVPTEFPPEPHTHVQYLTEETDPTVPAHVKDITQADIDLWNTPSAPSLALNDLTDVDTVGAIAGDVPILGVDGIWRPGVPVASFVGGRQTTVNTDLSWVAQWECVIYSPSYDKIYAGSTSADYGLGAQHIAVTSDMKTWTYLNVPIRVYAIADNGAGVLVCSGDAGTTGYRSTDGINWSAVTIGINDAVALAWDAAAGVFIAVSDATDQVRISSDGITWSNGVVLTAFDGGWRRLSVGKHTGKVYVSAYMNAGARTDIIGVISSGGTVFSAFTHPSAPSVYGVIELSATKIVAGTKNGAASTFFVSNDAGSTWSVEGEGSDPKIHAMAQSDSCIVAIAYSNPSDATIRILWSEDGVTWTYIPYRPYDRNFTGIAYFPKYDAFIITIGASSSTPYVSRGIILRV